MGLDRAKCRYCGNMALVPQDGVPRQCVNGHPFEYDEVIRDEREANRRKQDASPSNGPQVAPDA